MQLTARMIADRMGSCLSEAHIADDDMTGYDTVRVLLAEDNIVRAGQAYIVDSSRLSSLLIPDSSSLVICPQEPDFGLPCSVIICRGSIDVIYQSVLAAFSAYSSLENELSEGILGDWDLNRLLIPLVRFFENPVQVYAPIFNVVTGVKPVFTTDGVFCGTETFDPPIAADIVHGMTRSSDLLEELKIKETHYFKYTGFDFGCYQINLIEADNFVGRLVLINQYMASRIGVADTLNIIAKYIRHHMVHHSSALRAKLFTVDYTISDILEGRSTNNRLIATQLSAISWPVIDSFGILYFSFLTESLPTKDLSSYHVQAFSQLMRHAIVLSMDDSIVAVFRLKDLPLESIEGLLEPYLSTSDIYAGQGEPFFDFRSARSSYLQAKAAFRLGIDSKRTGRIFRYQDYAVEHLISKAVESESGSMFIHSAITRIEAYDYENQADLLLTLRTYLENHCNQVASAQILHIHRNSLKYRVQKLNEIMGIDLKNTNLHLRLILSILIRERQMID